MKNAKWVKAPKMDTLPRFEKSFSLTKQVKKATLYITSMGFYKASINGKQVESYIFAPGYTSFKKRVMEQKYDVTESLSQNNKISVLLAGGWGGAIQLSWAKDKYPYFEPSLIFDLEITYIDGTKEFIVSDENLDVFSTHILYAEIYAGEAWNQNLPSKYIGKALISNVKSKIVPFEGEKIVEGEHLLPRSLFKDNLGNTIVDFGQNFAGYIQINIQGKKGETISFLPCEMLDKNGNFYDENYREVGSKFSYVLTGEKDCFKPLFSFQGLRYIKLVDIPENVSLDNFVGIRVHSEMKRTGYFKCGNNKINQLYRNIIYGQLSNYIDVPTDCPQRDERLGWLGDAQVFCRTAAINYQVEKFFAKWLHDMALDQYKDGALEGIAPIVPVTRTLFATGWGDACTICPWEMYRAYGNKQILKDAFPMMKKWVGYILSQCTNKPYIWDNGDHYGDWLALDAPIGAAVGSTSIPLIATAFFAHSTEIIVESGKAIGEDVSYYEELYKNIKNAYQKEFLEDGMPKGKKVMLNSQDDRSPYSQTGIILTLHFNLCEEKDREKLTKALLELIHENGDVMTTGFLGTPYILRTLCEQGEYQTAYNLLFQEKNPSWLYSVNKGATTIWEHWDGVNDDGDFWNPCMNSFNHYAYGSVYDWIFENAVGIHVLKPKYEEILVKPIIDERLGFVEGSYESSFGKICVNWYLNDNAVNYTIEIPKGITAHIELENGLKTTVEEGIWYFSYEK